MKAHGEQAGLGAEFDSGALTVHVTVPPEASRVQVIRLRGGRPPELARAKVEPQPYSAFVNVRSAFDWVGSTSSALKRGLQPVRIELDGAGNLFDWVLEGGLTIEEDAPHAWVRKETRLVHDRLSRGIRLQLGDLSYETTGFQTRQPLGGFSLGTNFDLQPYKVSEPAGSREFTLEMQARVEVIVNGRIVRSLQLLPGRYDLRDFRLGSGLNDVRIRIRDKLGRVRELHFGLSFEPRLLATGTSEYSVSVGARTIREDGLIRYDTDNPSYTLFHRYGLSDALTIGGYLQGDPDRRMFGLETVYASGLGTLRTDAALSRDEDAGTGYAGRVQYEYYDASTRNPSRRRWVLSAVGRSRRFAGLGGAAPDNRTVLELSGTVSQEFRRTGIRGSFAASYQEGRKHTPDTGTVSMTVRRRIFRDWEVELSLDRRFVSGERPEQSAFVTVAWSSRDRNHSARFDHETTDHSTQLEWQYTPSQAVGGTGASVRSSRSPQQYEVGASLQHVGTRLEGEMFHTSSAARKTTGLDEHRTSVRLATAVAFTGGAFAFSRPISESFAVVVSHPSLEGKTIGVDRSAGGSVAQVDRFGPAVLPNLIPYQVRAVSIDAPDLPPGFHLGDELFEVRPRYRSGLLIKVGTAATVAARGVLTLGNGEPVALEGGIARSLEDPAESFVFFTNRKGRFSLAGLRPGRYELRLHVARERVVRFEIPEGTAGLHDVGRLALPARDGAAGEGARR